MHIIDSFKTNINMHTLVNTCTHREAKKQQPAAIDQSDSDLDMPHPWV